MARAFKRISSELKKFREDPPPFVRKVHVDDKNCHQFHFLVDGPSASPFEGGEYVLNMVIPAEYPFAAPRFKMLTPNGRFAPGSWICISGASSHHPENWSPSQNFCSLLVSIISFMLDENAGHHVGSVASTAQHKQHLAGESRLFNTRQGFDKFFN